jgi:hypothetical protein
LLVNAYIDIICHIEEAYPSRSLSSTMLDPIGEELAPGVGGNG